LDSLKQHKALEKSQLIAMIETDVVKAFDEVWNVSKSNALDDDLTNRIVLVGSDLYLYQQEEQDLDYEKEIKGRLIDTVEELPEEIWSAQGSIASSEKFTELRNFFLSKNPKNQKALSVEAITKAYSKNAFRLSEISMELNMGEILGIIGENGNGKSTLLKLIGGELSTDSGTINYPFMDNNEKKNWMDLKQHIAFVPQKIRDWGSIDSVKNQLHFYATIKGLTGEENISMVNFFINRLGLKKYENHKWNDISGGYQLRFELAKALLWKPKLLILDEPLANLDIKAQASLLKDLKHLVKSIKDPFACIISSQSIYDVERLADKVVFLKNGDCLFQGPKEYIGVENNYHCYEFSSDWDYETLKQTLKNGKIIKLVDEGQTMLLYIEKSMTQAELFNLFSSNDIQLDYIRNISSSTRILFES
jgi:ABC-2 type transport system ATP-binding protein